MFTNRHTKHAENIEHIAMIQQAIGSGPQKGLPRIEARWRQPKVDP